MALSDQIARVEVRPRISLIKPPNAVSNVRRSLHGANAVSLSCEWRIERTGDTVRTLISACRCNVTAAQRLRPFVQYGTERSHAVYCPCSVALQMATCIGIGTIGVVSNEALRHVSHRLTTV